MATRAEVIAAARTLFGTPWHAHARLPGIGVDCIGVPIVTAWITGLKPRTFDIQGYSIAPDGSLMTECAKHMDRITRAEMQPGDMIVLRWGRLPHHVGVLGDWRHGGLSIIHAENVRHNQVIEHRLWLDGAMQFVAAFRFPGIEA